MNFKQIHIGQLIAQRVLECDMKTDRILQFFDTTSHAKITAMYQAKSLNTEIVLKWSKLLRYDFFRVYSQHLILYKPHAHLPDAKKHSSGEPYLPQFKKQLYTKAIIDFVLELIATKAKTPADVIMEYGIPKTTLYKWIKKYSNNEKP